MRRIYVMALCPARARRHAFLLLLYMLAATAAAQPAVQVGEGIAFPDPARAVLLEIMQDAGVHAARVTSTYRPPEEQVRVMYGYIRRHGVDRAKALYGPEGDAVIEVYDRNRNRPEEEVLALMTAELERQLPAAFAHKRLMHLHPCYFTFDVSMRSISVAYHRAFSEAAARHRRVHRFLGPDQGEREAFHIEVPRQGDCPIDSP